MESKPWHKIRTKFVKTISVPLDVLISYGYSGSCMPKIYTNPPGMLNTSIPPIIELLSALGSKPVQENSFVS